MTVSLADCAEMFDLVAPFIKLEYFNRDEDHTGSLRPRIEVRLPADLVFRVLEWEKPCVACSDPMRPFRQRKGSKPGQGIYYAAACPERPADEIVSRWVRLVADGSDEQLRQALLEASQSFRTCCKGKAASQEYLRVAEALKARPPDHPSLEDTFAMLAGEPPPEPVVEVRSSDISSLWSYFIAAFDTDQLHSIKIGESEDPSKRLRELQTGCPLELRIMGATRKYHEKELHRQFAHLWVRREWYRPAPDLLTFIEDSCGEPETPQQHTGL